MNNFYLFPMSSYRNFCPFIEMVKLQIMFVLDYLKIKETLGTIIYFQDPF